LDVERGIIDRNIACLEVRIRALKSRRNELSPISRLPVEILCNIFSFIDDYGYLKPKSWTNFSRVSQHWRSSALSAPELWAMPLRHYRWAQEMLIRSKMAKLTIRSHHSFERSTIETFRSCFHEVNRIKEISIMVSGLIWEDLFRGLPKSAPQLRKLCFQNYSSTTFSIPEDFFYDTDRLRRVKLINCKISWGSRLLTGLSRLTLNKSLKANSSIIQFLHALQRMPALTGLHLTDSIPDDSKGPSTYPVVDLPCLRVLEISSGIGALTAALRHITFPHSAILHLTCKGNQSTQIDPSIFFSVLVTKFLSSLVIRSLSLEVLAPQGLEFCVWTTAIIQDQFFSDKPQLQLHFIWSPSDYMRVLTSAFDAMNLPSLTSLRISTNNYFDSQTWVRILGKLPILERVCAEGGSTHSFLEALVYKTKASEKSKTAHRTVSFPKLRYIHLRDTFFETTSANMLLDYLMERRERNAEIQVLHLHKCSYISSDDVERFKEIVDVISDGMREGLSEEDRTRDWLLKQR
jgi:F-box-like